ncbi:hypothetical protein J7E78_16680 [Paenibacillus polymyxa]|uniref:hypothetical protein n=1 Tax=Paenibacillus polymyxa TaxID=1406 RepID=UPI001BE8780E|nr:hypothetical protein [Paenibacillus polymyxa]MBT2285178.1 hypothetical protein [Paenibacillus polymyxa]
MLIKASIKSLFRITALTMAFLIFATTAAQSYSFAAELDSITNDQEAHTSSLQEETAEETQNSSGEIPTDDNYHNVNIGDLEFVGEELSPETSMIVGTLPWVGMNLGRLLGWLAGGVAVLDTIRLNGIEVTRVYDFAIELARSKEKNKPKYFTATYRKELYIINAITEERAITLLEIDPTINIWTPTMGDARNLAKKVAANINGTITISENHWETGKNDTYYYHHFHAKKGQTWRSSHIFYGATGLLGKNK